MKRSALVASAFALVLIGVFSSGWIAVSARESNTLQAAPAGKGWEYATLRYEEMIPNKPWHWATAGGTVLVDGSAADIMKAIGGPVAPGWQGEAGLVAQAGAQGWEIVLITPHGRINDFWFKRPVH